MLNTEFFLECWYKLRKAKSCFDHFLVALVKNDHDLLGLRAIKSAVLSELMNWDDIFHANTNLEKVKVKYLLGEQGQKWT